LQQRERAARDRLTRRFVDVDWQRPLLEHVPFEWNRMRSTSFSVAHVLFGKPASIFPEHALTASAKPIWRTAVVA
jgi:hypothetical protein